MKRALIVLVIGFLQSVSGAAVADDGWFGIGVKAEGEGRFWNPVVTELVVTSVENASPAANAGIKAGDRIVAIGEHKVVGQRLRILAPYIEKRVGEALTLTLLSETGDSYTVTMVGEQRPEEDH